MEFPFFSRFPVEIQIKVFTFAATAPRTIHIQWERLYPENFAGTQLPYDEGPWVDDFTSHDPAPAILHTCQLARQTSKNIYTKAFRPRRNPDSVGPFTVGDESHYVWVNFEVDKFSMSFNTLRDTREAEKAQIRELVLRVGYIGEEFEPDYIELLTGMKSLHTLHISSSLELHQWRGLLDTLWGIFEDLFGAEEGWHHPVVRIVEENTGDTMTYLNEERWHERFYADRFERLVLNRQDLGQAAGKHISRRERFASFRETYKGQEDRRRPLDPREESLECNYIE